MPIPLSVLVYESGANGVPQVTGRADSLRGKIDAWEHSIVDRYGFEGARCSWNATIDEALDWARPDQLMRACEVFNPSGGKVWEGFLSEIEVSIGRVKLALSIKDMANRLIVRYSASDGTAAPTSTYTNAASIALYGTKDRLLNLSSTSSAGAAARAQTALNQIAFPKSKQPSEGGSGSAGEVTIALKFMGWYEVLGWLLTGNTSTTTTSASTQAASLLAAYAATNAFLSTDTTQIQASLPSDTEYIDPETTYRAKLDNLFALGDASHERLHWGMFEDRALLVRTWAGAAETTIGYYESARTGQITDVYGNHLDPWDLRPDVMCQVVDVLDTDAPEGAIDSATRKYVARVTCRISGSGVSYTLEPEDVESLESLLASPAGGGAAGTSDRQAKLESTLIDAIQVRFPVMDNPIRYNPATGTWNPQAGGTGVINTGTITTGAGSIDTGGGSITTGGGSIATGGGSISLGGGSIATGGGNVSNTGGGHVDLGTGTGIGGAGSSGVTSPGGTPGALAKWSSSSVLTNAVAGTDYAAASHTHAAADVVSGTMATARLGSGTANSTSFLRGDQTWAVPTAGAVGAAPDSATYIVQTANAGLSNEQALGALATGLLKNTTTTGVLSIAAAGDLPNHASRHETGGADALTALAAGVITSGTMATARLGSGTASAATVLWGDSTWAALVAGDLPSHTHAAADITSGTMATARLGSGTASASTLLWGDSTWAALVAGDLPSHTHAAADITSGTMATARLGSGTASSSTFLRGDSSWQSVPSGAGANTRVAFWTGTNTLSSDTGLIYDSTNKILGVGGTPTYTVHAFDTAPTIMAEASGTGTAQYSMMNTNRQYSMAVQSSSWILYDNTSGTNRIEVSSAGDTGIGQAPSSTSRLIVRGKDTSNSNYSLVLTNSSPTTEFYVTNGGVGYLNNTAWSYSSDMSKKQNIRNLNKDIVHFMQLEPKMFDYVDGPANRWGYIAQDVQQIIPDLIRVEEDGMLSMATTDLLPLFNHVLRRLIRILVQKGVIGQADLN